MVVLQGAGLTVADPLTFYRLDLWTASFIAVSPSFFMKMFEVLHIIDRVILWTSGIAIKIVTNLIKEALVPDIIGNP